MYQIIDYYSGVSVTDARYKTRESAEEARIEYLIYMAKEGSIHNNLLLVRKVS